MDVWVWVLVTLYLSVLFLGFAGTVWYNRRDWIYWILGVGVLPLLGTLIFVQFLVAYYWVQETLC